MLWRGGFATKLRVMSSHRPIPLPATRWPRSILRHAPRLNAVGLSVRVLSFPVVRNPGNGHTISLRWETLTSVVHPRLGEILPAATEGEVDAFVTGLFLEPCQVGKQSTKGAPGVAVLGA